MAYFHTTVLDNQIKALPTVDTASGSIATFDTDLTENLVSVKCQIVAKQASGTPSPDNPLPITTYTEMNVFATGKNLFNADKIVADSNHPSYVYIDNGYLRFTTGSPIVKNIVWKNLHIPCPVTFSGIVRNFDTTSSGVINVEVFFSDGTSIQVLLSGSIATGVEKPFNNTIGTTGQTIVKIQGVWNNEKEVGFDLSVTQLEIGATRTAYEPYNGTTANIPFGQTVANGVLDITTGKLTITHGFKTFNGSESWNKHGSIASWFYVDNQIDGFMNSTMDNFQICNMGEQTKYDYVTTLTNGHFAYGSANKRFVFKNTDYTETTDFKTWLSNNNMQVAYRLPSDLIIQLDSITLQALLNENNIWCDTGDTEVKFLLTVGKKYG